MPQREYGRVPYELTWRVEMTVRDTTTSHPRSPTRHTFLVVVLANAPLCCVTRNAILIAFAVKQKILLEVSRAKPVTANAIKIQNHRAKTHGSDGQ